MLSVLASSDTSLRDAFGKILAFEHVEDTPFASVFRKANRIFITFNTPITDDHVSWIASEFLPDRLYLPFVSYAIDMVHEVGDVVVPNVFFSYDSRLKSAQLDENNRDSFIENPKFLTSFLEQKDYYVEDFGLSLGGIVVDDAPKDPSEDLTPKMMLAYEGDIYVEDGLSQAIEIVEKEEIPTVILCGIIKWKDHTKHKNVDPYELAVRNILTTCKLIEDEE